jgi:hypothetical protein
MDQSPCPSLALILTTAFKQGLLASFPGTPKNLTKSLSGLMLAPGAAEKMLEQVCQIQAGVIDDWVFGGIANSLGCDCPQTIAVLLLYLNMGSAALHFIAGNNARSSPGPTGRG